MTARWPLEEDCQEYADFNNSDVLDFSGDEEHDDA